MDAPSAAELKTKWQATSWYAVRDPDHPSDGLNLRVRRALSWLERAEDARRHDDHDVAFILYWIAFNAVYGQAGSAAYYDQPATERDIQRTYLRKISSVAPSLRTVLASQTMPDTIYALLNSKYVYEPFWKGHAGVPRYRDWLTQFKRLRYTIWSAVRRLRATTNTADAHIESVLCELFDRLYTLRNQLLHGGATWNSSVNREQVMTGTAAIATLLPCFIDVMIEHPDADWGAPRYPVVKN